MIKLGLYLVAKFAIAASFLIIYPFAGELFPTEVRGIGIGFAAYVGGIGLCIIPFVNYLVRNHLLKKFTLYYHARKVHR
jgi:nitrate/nitrite transporter NarK